MGVACGMRIDKTMHEPQPMQYSENNKKIAIDGHKASLANEAMELQQKTPNKEEIDMAISVLNESMEPLRTNVKFEMHEKLEKYYVSVVDTNTDEVLKEIPPKKMLDMYAEMAEFMGILVDEKI